MTCTNCGKELSPEEKFCGNCGTKVEQSTPVEETKDAPVIGEEQNQNGNSLTPNAPKKTINLLAIGIGIVALIAVIAVAFPFVKNLYMKSFASNEDYFKATQRAEAEVAVDLIADLFDVYQEQGITDTDGIAEYLKSTRFDMDISMKLSEKITDYISDNVGTELSFLKDASLGYGVELDDDNANLTVELGLDNKKLITADTIIDLKDFITYVTIPELSDTAMRLDLEKLTGQDFGQIFESDEFKEAFESTMSMYENLPDGKTFKSIAMRYLDIILQQVKTVAKTENTVTINGKDTTYTHLSAVFTPDDLEALSVALLEAVKNDDELQNIIEGFTNSVPELVISKDDLINAIDEQIAEIDGSFDEIGTLTYSILVDKASKIKGYQLYSKNKDGFSFICNENGFIFEVTEQGEETATLVFNGNLFAEVVNGDALLSVNGEQLLNIKVEDMTSDGSSVKITFTPAAALQNQLAEIQATSDIPEKLGIDLTKCSVILKVTSDLDSKTLLGGIEYGIALTSDNGPIASVIAAMEYTKPDGINLPEKYTDIEGENDIIEWISGANILGFIGSLPESISSAVMNMMLSGQLS